jgi:hypothetical protein
MVHGFESLIQFTTIICSGSILVMAVYIGWEYYAN